MSWRERQWRTREQIVRYDAAITYVDHEIGKLVKHLETCGILDQTLLIVTADHGESFTEHGLIFTHLGLYDVTIHVPLILRYPDFTRNKKVKGFVQHFDILPTIMDILDIKYKDYDGKSAIRTNGYKYIQALSRIYQGPTKELYDVNKDPGETKNIISEKPNVANMLKKRLTDWINSLNLKKNQLM